MVFKGVHMKIFILTIFILSFTISPNIYAQEKPNDGKETFYRAVKHSDLITILPPRNDGSGSLFGKESFFTGGGDCPDEINIGSVTDEDSIFGGIDIDLFIDADITIICN